MHVTTRAVAALVMLSLAGCGSSTVRVTGDLLKGGVPFTPPEGRKHQVVLFAMNAPDAPGSTATTGEPYAAVVNQADATFEVPGPEGRGIPPGKYRVSVTQMDRSKHTVEKPKKRGEPPVNRDTDYLKNQYGPTTSPIIVDLTASEKLTIDLDRPVPATSP